MVDDDTPTTVRAPSYVWTSRTSDFSAWFAKYELNCGRIKKFSKYQSGVELDRSETLLASTVELAHPETLLEVLRKMGGS